MTKEKKENLIIAQSVWIKYLNGVSKVAIAKELAINRSQVIYIIQFTTPNMIKRELKKSSLFNKRTFTIMLNRIKLLKKEIHDIQVDKQSKLSYRSSKYGI